MTTETATVTEKKDTIAAASAMPKEIAEAVLEIMAGVEKMENNAENKETKKRYVSIDLYLEKLKPLCTKAGLIIYPIQISNELKVIAGKYGSNNVVEATYEFMLIHKTGVSWSNPHDRKTVCHIWNGGVACGATQSFAFKAFVRALFMMATGEPEDDAEESLPKGKDASPAQRRPALQQRNAYAQAKADSTAPAGDHESNGTAAEPSAVLTAYEKALSNAHTEDGVKHVSREHKPAIAALDSDGKAIASRMQRKALIRAKTAAAIQLLA